MKIVVVEDAPIPAQRFTINCTRPSLNPSLKLIKETEDKTLL